MPRRIYSFFITGFFLLTQAAAMEYAMDDSIRRLNSIKEDTAYITLASAIAKHYLSGAEKEETFSFIGRQMELRKNEPVKYQNLLVLTGKTHYQNKDYQQSLQFTDSLLNSGFSFLPDIEAKLYRLKGQNYFRTQDFPKSLEYYKKALSVLKSMSDSSQTDDVLSAIGAVYFEIDNLPEALRYAKEAEKISLATNDLDSRSRILNTLANISKTLGQNDEAKRYYEEALAVSEKTGDSEGRILTTSGIALLEMQRKNFSEAIVLQLKALTYAEELQNKHYIGGMYMNLGRIYWEEEKKDEAIRYYKIGVALAGETGDKQNLALGNANLGFLNAEKKDYLTSNDFLNLALPPVRETGDLALQREIYGGFYDNYKALNQPQKALHYHELYKTFADSVLNDDKSQELNRLKTQFAVEEKEKELQSMAEQEKAITDAEIGKQKLLRNFSIAGILLLLLFAGFVFQRYRERHHTSLLLEEKNKSLAKALGDLKSMQEELVQTEKQREAQSVRVRIARDIHDEIGSGLTKITMLSDLVRKKTGQAELADSLSKITAYSKNVSASLGEIVWAIHPGHDNVNSLVQYMKTIAGRLLEDSGIHYTHRFPNHEIHSAVHPEVKRNIYLVMKEALHNALKYSGAKNISVSFDVSGNEFRLVIEDDGIGFNADAHVAERGESGNGLYNMRQRMLQHGNSLQVVSSAGKGCKIIAEGKLSEPAEIS